MRDSFFAILCLAAIILTCGTFYLACQSDMKTNDMRKECLGKGGVWYHDGRQCLDIKTLPIKEP